MPSINNLTTNSRSMNGLNTIDANSINTDNLDVDYLTVNINSTVPTVTPASTSSSQIASTAFVQNALSSGVSGFAKLGFDNTFTGFNVFAGGVEIQNTELYINPNTQINLGGNLSVDVGINTYTITPTEISYLDGITSNVQTQLSDKASLTSVNTFTNTNNFNQAKGTSASAIVNVKDTTGNKTISLNPNSSATLNPLVSAGEMVIASVGSAIDTATLTLTNWATVNMGLKITPTLCRLRAGTNWLLVDSTAGSSCTGSFVFNGKVGSSTTNVQFGDTTTFQSVTTASQNVCLGQSIGQNVTSAQQNLVVGYNSGNGLTDGTQNVVLGVNSAGSLNHGSYNVFISGGAGARVGSSVGEQSNVVIGYNSLITHTGSSNICIGRSAMRGDAGATTYDSQNNTIIGTSAFFNAQTCSNNTAIGVNAGSANTTGSNNCFFGVASGQANVTNSGLSCFGAYSGYTPDTSSLASNRMIFGSSTLSEDYLFAGTPTLNARATTTAVNLFTTSTDNITIGSTGGTLTSNKIVSCSIAPTTGNHLTNKTYVDGIASTITTSNNVWTGTNTFDNNVLIKNTAGTTETFEAKDGVNIAPLTAPSRVVTTTALTYTTVHSFTNTAGYTGRCIFTLPIAIYNSGTGVGGVSTTFNVTLSAVPYQILKNGVSYVAPTTPYIVGGALPDTKTLVALGTTPYSCEIYICEISFAFDITSASADTYAIQLSYTGSTTNPSSTNNYISCGIVSTFSGTPAISMTSSTNSGYIAGQFNASPVYIPTTTMNNNGYVALPRIINTNPCGTIIQSISKIVPYGYLLADGSTINIADYPDLFGLIQYDYGYGTYGVSFKLPNLQGTFLRGAGSQTYSGVTYATTAGAFQQDQTLTIKQQGFYNFSTGSGRQCPARFNVGTDPVDTGVSTFADRMGAEVRPFNFGVYNYIKY